MHPQQLNFEPPDASIVIFGFAQGGRSQSERFLGLSFKILGDTPSSVPPVDDGRILFRFTALILSSSVVLLLFAGAYRMGGGGLSFCSSYSPCSTESNSRMGSLVIVDALAEKHKQRVTATMGSFPSSLNSSVSGTDPRLDIDPKDPALVILVLLVNDPLSFFLDVPAISFVDGLVLFTPEFSFLSLDVWVPPLKLTVVIPPRWYAGCPCCPSM